MQKNNSNRLNSEVECLIMVYICGDTHGWNDIAKLEELKRFRAKRGEHEKKSDYLIILGDTAIGFNKSPMYNDKLLEYYRSLNLKVLIVGGNHDNYDFLDDLPKSKRFGTTVGKISDNIFYLERGKVYTIENKKFFVFGGAHSIDKYTACRIEHIDWWEHEDPTQRDINRAIINLVKNSYEVDYILTHTAPERVIPSILKPWQKVIPCKTSQFLDSITDKIKFKCWMCGHFHEDIQVNMKANKNILKEINVLYHRIHYIDNDILKSI